MDDILAIYQVFCYQRQPDANVDLILAMHFVGISHVNNGRHAGIGKGHRLGLRLPDARPAVLVLNRLGRRRADVWQLDEKEWEVPLPPFLPPICYHRSEE